MPHVWSNNFHFGAAKRKRTADNYRETFVVEIFNAIPSISYLDGVCEDIKNVYDDMKRSTEVDERKQRYMAMRQHYKRLVAEYMRRRWVSPKDVMAPTHQQKLSKVIWATYHVPVLFVGMLVNDDRGVYRERKGNGLGRVGSAQQ